MQEESKINSATNAALGVVSEEVVSRFGSAMKEHLVALVVRIMSLGLL